MAVRMQDLTKQPERCVFTESPPEEINYAEAFWHSVRLQPTMESRLVSSDIKQRLGTKKITSKSSEGSAPNIKTKDSKLTEFFLRARALDQIAEFERLRRLAELRLKDREALHQRRQERIQREELSRGKVKRRPTVEEIEEARREKKRSIGEAYGIEQMIREIEEFEQRIEAERANQGKSTHTATASAADDPSSASEKA